MRSVNGREIKGTGLWSVPHVPHRGWQNVGMDDVGASHEICQMCQAREIRYVHEMWHDTYLQVLRVGRICAANMEQNSTLATKRETRLKSDADRRQRFVKGNWQLSGRGNPHRKLRGVHFTLLKAQCGLYRVRIALGDDLSLSEPLFTTMEDAANAIFDAMEQEP